MSPQRSAAVLAALCGTFVLAGWGAAGLVSLVLPGIENGGVPIAVATPQATATADKDVGVSSSGNGEGRCGFRRPWRDAAARRANRAERAGEHA